MTGKLNFADAPSQKDFTVLIPHGMLAFGVLSINYYNLDRGMVETPSKSSAAKYLDCEVTVEGGEFNRRKIFTRIGVEGSEAYVNMGRSAIRAILEVGRGAGPNAMGAYAIEGYHELDGLKVAIKVKEDPEKNGYPAKNEIAVWLSPVDPATSKDFERLLAGDTAPKNVRAPVASGGAPAQAAAPAWQRPAAPATASPQQTPPSKPSWLA
jgi:hypothetical protein